MNHVHAVVLAVSTVSLIACSDVGPMKAPESNANVRATILRENAREAGRYHTEVMEHTLSALQKERAKRGATLSHEQICDVLSTSLREFKHVGAMQPDNEVLRAVAMSKTGCAPESSSANRGVSASVSVEPETPLHNFGMEETTMSPELQALLDRLAALSESGNDDYDVYIAGVTSIENDAANTLGQNEVEPLFELTSLARESASYWNTNINSWWAAVGGNPARCTDPVCVETAYSRGIAFTLSVPLQGFGPRHAGFAGPICTYSCSPQGRKIVGKIISFDVGGGVGDLVKEWIAKRSTLALLGAALNLRTVIAYAAGASVAGAIETAVESWL